MNGINGCNNLTPASRQINKVSADLSFYSADPFVNKGLVASR
jgi:hypothetical protein